MIRRRLSCRRRRRHLRAWQSGLGEIEVIDIDAEEGSGEVHVQLTAENGVIYVENDVPGGVSAEGIEDNGTNAVSVVGPVGLVNGTLASGAFYLPDIDYRGQDSLAVTARDLGNFGAGGEQTASGVIPVQVRPLESADGFEFTGHVTSVDEPLAATFGLDEPFQVSLEFDAAFRDMDPDPAYGQYFTSPSGPGEFRGGFRV